MRDSTAGIFNRRAFLVAGAGVLLAGGLGAADKTRPGGGAAAAPAKKLKGFAPLEMRPLRIEAGASKPFKAVHVSDAHIIRVDATEKDSRKVNLASRRYPHMPYGEHYLAEAVMAARREDALLLHTGDMIDFVSNANLRLVERYFGSADWFGCSGNHEFSKYMGEAKEDADYRASSLTRVSKFYPNDLTFASRVVNGVNFVAIDDVYYKVTAEQLALMEKEVAKGLPIVLMCHVPFYAPGHYERELKMSGGVSTYETGVPDELIATWRAPDKPFAKGREWCDARTYQRADEPTKEFVKYIKAQSLLKAVLCGHNHRYWQGRFSPYAMQYVCSATYMGQCYAIDFV